jgi:secreted Zn-dependent insulinase-like peptidase
VQGSKKFPLEIDNSISEVISLALEKVKNCNGKRFEEVKEAILARLNRKDDNLSERSSRIWREIVENTYEFGRNKELIKSLDKINHESLLKMSENIFINNPARLTIHNYSFKSNKYLLNKPIPYELNNKINVMYTDSVKALEKNDFIHAYIVRKFSNTYRKIKKILKHNKIKDSKYYAARKRY